MGLFQELPGFGEAEVLDIAMQLWYWNRGRLDLDWLSPGPLYQCIGGCAGSVAPSCRSRILRQRGCASERCMFIGCHERLEAKISRVHFRIHVLSESFPGTFEGLVSRCLKSCSRHGL